jgi:hypothetical protein
MQNMPHLHSNLTSGMFVVVTALLLCAASLWAATAFGFLPAHFLTWTRSATLAMLALWALTALILGPEGV